MDLAALRKRLIAAEGLRLLPYTDTTGHLTVGVGHNLSQPLSHAAWNLLLDEDINLAVADAETFHWFPKLSDIRQRVIVEMVFNLGLPKLKTFNRFLVSLAQLDYSTASMEMLNSLWASQVGKRALILAAMMLTDHE